MSAAPPPAGVAPDAAGAPDPAIHDLGYKRYDGPRIPHGRRYLTVMRIALKLSLRWWLWLTVVFAVACTFAYGLAVYAFTRAPQMMGNELEWLRPDALVLKCLTAWYGVIPLVFFLGLFAGGSAIADDARAGGFQYYFARPVSKEHYLAGKLLAVCGLTTLIAAGPGILLALWRAALATPGQLGDAGLLLVRSTGLGLLVGLTLGVPIVALSSLSPSRGLVQGGWAAVFMLSWIVGRIVAAVVASPWPALISIPANLQVVGAAIFGLTPSYAVPWWASALVLAALLGGSVALLRWRLSHVEALTVS